MALTRIKTGQIEDGTIIGDDISASTSISSDNLTLSGDLRGPATFTIDPAAVGDNTGTVVIAGDLQVDGTTTTINSTTLTVEDKQIVVASGATDNTSADGAGLLVGGSGASITYDGTNDEFDINKSLNVDSGTLYVDSANNQVGIGTSSPSEELTIRAALPTVHLEDTLGSDVYTKLFHNNNFTFWEARNGASNAGFILHTRGGGINKDRLQILDNGDISFFENTGTTPKFFWDASAERLGIGTSSPEDKLNIHNGDISLTSQRDKFLRFTDLGNGQNGIITFNKINGDETVAAAIGSIGGASSSFNRKGLGFYTADNPNYTTELDFTNDLRMIVDSKGRVGIGTNSPSEKLEVNGNIIADGVYLGGTGSANYLDDYETGTWTPTFGGSGGGFSSVSSFSVNNATYVKIGKKVFIEADFTPNGDGSSVSSGNLAIDGIPFSASYASFNQIGAGRIDFSVSNSASTMLAVLVRSGNVNRLTLTVSAVSPGGSSLNSRPVRIFASYETDN